VTEPVLIRREWAMASPDTFDVPQIGRFVWKYLRRAKVSVDPYARNKRWATHTNDLNPATAAEHHMDATDFLRKLHVEGVRADLVIIDPPYSPRQVKECYDSIGQKMEQDDALLGKVRAELKKAIYDVLSSHGIVLTFGWNTVGMGRNLGFEQIEILLVCHGSDHNDTICLAERRAPDLFSHGLHGMSEA